jgi:hypothetical protein
MWWLQSETGIDTILLVGLATYMYLGFRRAYHSPPVRSAVNAIILAAATGGTIGAYHNLLFYLAFWST